MIFSIVRSVGTGSNCGASGKCMYVTVGNKIVSVLHIAAGFVQVIRKLRTNNEAIAQVGRAVDSVAKGPSVRDVNDGALPDLYQADFRIRHQ